jgi:cbb3-type cytochrome c oxidase subunit I
MSSVPEQRNEAPRVEVGLVRAHAFAALAMVLWSALLGLVIALKFHWPDLMGERAWLTWGRLRYAHTQGIFFGWLGNAFLMFLYHAVPRLAGRPVVGRTLGWVLFLTWNFLVVIPGWVLVMAGYSQPLEWAEFPLITDAFVVLAFVMMAMQFVVPFFRSSLSDLYVSGWYIIGGIVFTMFAYPVGNLVPELVPGARGATFSGLWIHDAVGLYVTPFAVAIAYFVIPIATGRPIYSHFLSMLAFWMLFFIYPLNGTHHYVFSSIPMTAQIGAIVASVYLGMDVVLNVSNQLLSLRGESATVARDPALRYTWAGIVFYLVVSLQGSLQAIMPVNRFVHFSDWVIGHAHLAMIGFASFAAIGGMMHVWQRTPGVHYNARAASWSFWLLTTGLLLMVVDLTAAGLIQGELWQSEMPWLESVRASRYYWIIRSTSAIPLLAGFVALGHSMLTGPVGRVAVSEPTEPAAEPVPADVPVLPIPGVLRGVYVYTGLAGFGFFLVSFLVLAVWPNQALEQEIVASRPILSPGLSESEERGRAIYGREGCLNCHSQFVRFTQDDVRRFGPATQAWEGERDFPQLWGTRRVGPDLAREHGRRPQDWQLVHLWNPRYVVADSIMPGYPWLFEGSALRPTSEALDLVAYLNSLGRDAQVAGLGDSPSRMDRAEEARMGIFCDCAIPRTAGPAPMLGTDLNDDEARRFRLRGSALFARHCAGCHGDAGRGDGIAADALIPRPRDFTSAHFADRALSNSLWHGVRGSSMPAWNDLATNDLRALSVYVRALTPEAEAVPLPETDRSSAAALFAKNCASCHGSEGAGNGMSAGAVAPVPTNFKDVQPTSAWADKAIANGIAGTSMPPWRDKLSDSERMLLTRYVRSLYTGASSK